MKKIDEKTVTRVHAASIAVGYIIGAIIGLKARKSMYDKGMVKSFWMPGFIKEPGTYR